MVKIEQIDIERLKRPTPSYHIMDPTEAKLDAFAEKLEKGYLYVSDEIRAPECLRGMVRNLYARGPFNLIYEIGEFQGVIGFLNIVISHKADMMLKMWDASFWSKDAVRQGRQLVEYIIETFELKRVGTTTADPRIVKMARLVGFTEEGIAKNAFAWKGRMMDEISLSITR